MNILGCRESAENGTFLLALRKRRVCWYASPVDGQLEHDGADYAVSKGDVFLLPAVVGACLCRPRRHDDHVGHFAAGREHNAMKKLIVFDLDGTLAESKASIDAEMATLLSDSAGYRESGDDIRRQLAAV